jgi:hypothetical protein
MSNYVDDPYSCRIDIFKPSGRWYSTESIRFREDDYFNKDIFKAFKNALDDYNIKDYGDGYFVVCLDPYHENSHPLHMIINFKK